MCYFALEIVKVSDLDCAYVQTHQSLHCASKRYKRQRNGNMYTLTLLSSVVSDQSLYLLNSVRIFTRWEMLLTRFIENHVDSEDLCKARRMLLWYACVQMRTNPQPFPTYRRLLTYLQQTAFDNTVAKEETRHNEHFLLSTLSSSSVPRLFIKYIFYE